MMGSFDHWLDAVAEAIRTSGWAVTPPIVPTETLDALGAELKRLAGAAQARGGRRNLLDIAGVVQLARCGAVRAVAEKVLGPNCAAVRGILFDKVPAANWKVPWHQDLTVAVREARDVPGFGPWSVKAGVPHVQPSVRVLEEMLAVRVHLDPCGVDDGPLQVLPGSHCAGRLDSAGIEDWKARVQPAACVAARGSILAFRPLLLHSSSSAAHPTCRRVVHLEFAACHLPAGLEWYWRVQ